MLFIASLFVVSEALDSTGVTAWAGQQLIMRAGASRRRLVVLTMLLVAGAHRAHQRQRCGRRARADGGRARGAAEAVTVAAPDAPCLRRPRRFDAGPHRHAGERPRLGGRRRTPAPAGSASSSSRSSASRSSPARSPSSCCSGRGCFPTGRRRSIPPDLSEHARTLVDAVRTRRRRRSAAGRAGVADRRAATRPRLDLADHPGVTLVGVQRGGHARHRRRIEDRGRRHHRRAGRRRGRRRARRATLRLDDAAEDTAEPRPRSSSCDRRVGVSR